MRELVVVSGKGGTGKTSVTASFAFLAENAVIADCDVDAANMHLVLSPNNTNTTDFYSGNNAVVDAEKCIGCGICANMCRFDAVKRNESNRKYEIDHISCEGCGLCVRKCPVNAISFPESCVGIKMEAETRCGPMIHAKLFPGAENSGKLVTAVKESARQKAEEMGADMIIVDGPPGIGCPVIAAVSGATDVLIVTEPTVSGEHDLVRILDLVNHFGIPASVCINKYDINPDAAKQIEIIAAEKGASVAGRIKYDKCFIDSQIKGLTIAETESSSANEIYKVWNSLIFHSHSQAKL